MTVYCISDDERVEAGKVDVPEPKTSFRKKSKLKRPNDDISIQAEASIACFFLFLLTFASFACFLCN